MVNNIFSVGNDFYDGKVLKITGLFENELRQILTTCQYFCPYNVKIRSICEQLVADRHKITVFLGRKYAIKSKVEGMVRES